MTVVGASETLDKSYYCNTHKRANFVHPRSQEHSRKTASCSFSPMTTRHPIDLSMLDDDMLRVLADSLRQRRSSALGSFACCCRAFNALLQPELSAMREASTADLLLRLSNVQQPMTIDGLRPITRADWSGCRLSQRDCRLLACWATEGSAPRPLSQLSEPDGIPPRTTIFVCTGAALGVGA